MLLVLRQKPVSFVLDLVNAVFIRLAILARALVEILLEFSHIDLLALTLRVILIDHELQLLVFNVDPQLIEHLLEV